MTLTGVSLETNNAGAGGSAQADRVLSVYPEVEI